MEDAYVNPHEDRFSKPSALAEGKEPTLVFIPEAILGEKRIFICRNQIHPKEQ